MVGVKTVKCGNCLQWTGRYPCEHCGHDPSESLSTDLTDRLEYTVTQDTSQIPEFEYRV